MSFAVRPSQTLVSMQETHNPKEEEEEKHTSSGDDKTKNSSFVSENVNPRPGMGAQTTTTLKISGSSTCTYDFS